MTCRVRLAHQGANRCAGRALQELLGARKAVRASDLVERLGNEGADIVASSPAQFSTYLKTELARWAKVIKELHIRAE